MKSYNDTNLCLKMDFSNEDTVCLLLKTEYQKLLEKMCILKTTEDIYTTQWKSIKIFYHVIFYIFEGISLNGDLNSETCIDFWF